MTKWNPDTGKLHYKGTNEVPEGWIKTGTNVYEPNCAACIFRRFSVRPSDPPKVVIHCVRHRKNVTVEECRACPDDSIDPADLRTHQQTWVVPQPGMTEEERLARQARIEEHQRLHAEAMEAKRQATEMEWLPCKYRIMSKKKGCGGCSKMAGCNFHGSEFYKQQVYPVNCERCEVREES